MYMGPIVFTQLMGHLPRNTFRRVVKRYGGERRVRRFTCWHQFLCLAFAQLTYRESLRDIEACLRAVPDKLYHMGLGGGDLDREGVFRINIGVSKARFEALVGDLGSGAVDHRALDRFLPHPHYARQNWVCILNPGPQNAESVRESIAEAHSSAVARMRRRTDD